MGLNPKIPKKGFLLKQCNICKDDFGSEGYTPTKSIFYPSGYLPICNKCIKQHLIEEDFSWRAVDKLCQMADIPFVPKEFENLRKMNGDDVFPIYAQVFMTSEYEGLDWETYFKEFKRLEQERMIEDELPLLDDEKYRKLAATFGRNYDHEQLIYLNDLLEGIFASQNVNGKLQADQAIKLCKISLELDSRIRAGEDFDKLLTSYDKLVKTAEFTPKNAKNAQDFDSVGEIVAWLEKRGWKNEFYDGVKRDVVDETMKNIQLFNQRLYTNEPGVGEEIEKRIEGLKVAAEMEDSYGLNQDYDLDDYEKQALDLDDIEEFNPEV